MNTLRLSVRTLLSLSITALPLLLGSHNAAAATRQTLRQAHSGTYTSTTTRTGANGKTSTRNTTAVVDKENGTFNRDTTVTGPNGKTATRSTDVVRSDSSVERTTVLTKPNGETATTTTTRTVTPAP